ncbi:MAG TPA: LssY C-terminal domain-containing protein, partial [Candidatus Acidoferrum sp.]|nr:LssY C-terminal domain-containing protein [Candidatus Acidoferrum sp.]
MRPGESLWVRLLGPVSSYSGKAGEKVRAMVIESPACAGSEEIAPGTLVEGTIKAVRRVGMGLVHETANVRVEFDRLLTRDGKEIAISTMVVEIDNARETVKNGLIRGVNATDTPQGRITSRLRHLPTWNPYSDLTLLAYRAAFPVFPEPEIYLPRGTDLKLELTRELSVADEMLGAAPASPPDEIDRAIMEITAPSLPDRTTTRYGQAADFVNVALIGTSEQMDQAFRAAGWTHGDPTSPRSVLREMHAFLAFKNYPEAPISRQLMEGQPVSATWEKSLDSYEKREHLRVWARNDVLDGKTVWLGAMTRETGATLSVKRHKFIHHVEADVDAGRAMLARDLLLVGCVASVYYVERPGTEHAAMNATGDAMRTDGSLAIVQLKDCEDPVFAKETEEAPAVAARPHSKLARYIRMQILSFKSDVVRGNIVYGAFDLTRMAIRARRGRTVR